MRRSDQIKGTNIVAAIRVVEEYIAELKHNLDQQTSNSDPLSSLADYRRLAVRQHRINVLGVSLRLADILIKALEDYNDTDGCQIYIIPTKVCNLEQMQEQELQVKTEMYSYQSVENMDIWVTEPDRPTVIAQYQYTQKATYELVNQINAIVGRQIVTHLTAGSLAFCLEEDDYQSQEDSVYVKLSAAKMYNQEEADRETRSNLTHIEEKVMQWVDGDLTDTLTILVPKGHSADMYERHIRQILQYHPDLSLINTRDRIEVSIPIE